MGTFKIIKKGANNFWHWYNGDAKKVAISDFEVVLEEVSQTFLIVYKNGANVPQQAVSVLDIEVIDETDTSDVETFTNVVDLRARLVILGYTAYLSATGIQSVVAGTNITIDNTDPANPIISATGGGGGSVSANDVTETATRVFVTPTQKTAITHSNRSILDAITESFTTALKNAYDGAVSWITTNGTNILNHIASTSNPHSVTKSQVGLSNVPNTDTTTTANITDSTNKRFVTDANLTTIGNTTGTNSGDNATNTTSNAYADAKVEDAIVNGVTTKAPSQNAVFDALALKVDKTNWIDISLTSTIVGFSSFTTRIIRYKQISDNVIWVKGRLTGTSNSPLLNFDIPFTSANNAQNIGNATCKNNGSDLTSTIVCANNQNTNIVNIYRDNTGTTLFTTSGVKEGIFSILIEI